MTTFPNSPQLLKGGIVLIDPDTARGAARHRRCSTTRTR